MKSRYNQIKDSYKSAGYFMARALIPKGVCDDVIKAFYKEVIPYKGKLLRGNSGNYEKHQLSDNGFVTNPVIQIQEMDEKQFPGFRSSIFNVLSYRRLLDIISELMNDEPVLIQNGYFQSSAGSVSHFDGHIFDSSDGEFIGCWVALEDIDKNAGRFYLYPGSHSLYTKGAFPDDIYKEFETYHKLSLEIVRGYREGNMKSLAELKKCWGLLSGIIKKCDIKQYTPALKAGDVILFSSKTAHGSHVPLNQAKTRNSMFAHFTPGKKTFIRYQEQEEKLLPYSINGLLIQPSIR